VMTQDLTILDANMTAWYEKKQREIMARDMWSFLFGIGVFWIWCTHAIWPMWG
jgi:hypothetical protein